MRCFLAGFTKPRVVAPRRTDELFHDGKRHLAFLPQTFLVERLVDRSLDVGLFVADSRGWASVLNVQTGVVKWQWL
jgi:hypothetical protein